MGDRLIFQLGTNNWQRDGEFAPGSGILHEAHHRAYNELPGVRCYSMYPSRVQRTRPGEDDVRVFALDHDIPICESISPVSSYRWHAMPPEEVAAYRARLTAEVTAFIDDVEAATGDEFGLAIAHHAFMNAVVMRDVIRARVQAGRPRIPLVDFAHGTELKMYVHEQRGENPAEFPWRFLPFMQEEKIFDWSAGPEHGVDVVASISSEQIDAFASVFPEFPRERIVLSHNGYNQDVFHPAPETYADRERVLAGFTTQPPPGAARGPEAVAPEGGFDAVVAFVGKFADWKRLDALLRAAASYERGDQRVLTLVAGSGPVEEQVKMHELAAELGLERTYFLGPRPQDELATIFACADVGVFPSYREPFGLVFLECMACGTPVIGADSGGPRDFVTDAVGTLVPETDDRQALADSLAAAVQRSFDEGWKQAKGGEAARYARDGFSVVKQVSDLLTEVDRLTAG
ncbi:glycosyltransferase involved in cell wall biosynthesis [Actinomycetospora succinea]|uniref:Glycosyltransferase involved in cell wall biosynthesis n=1 Tax=Actinomycetospora succinea TaxID=663603 RepID=A0A4R6VSV6_9PSEU|nr:glycosyltransferase [Actinomycetospora succinea]TDQ63000.1 glycosyltransferase involved in cell wall biosynthesis [Actinomycetospora succinea]